MGTVGQQAEGECRQAKPSAATTLATILLSSQSKNLHLWIVNLVRAYKQAVSH